MSQRGTARRDSVCNSLEEKQKLRDKSESIRLKPDRADKDKNQIQFDKDFGQFKTEIKELFKHFDEKMDRKLNNLDKKFNDVLDELRSEVSLVKLEVRDTKADVKELREKVSDVEKSVSFQAEMQEENDDKQKDKMGKLRFELEEMNKKILLLEKYDRKYNLLFYGITEEPREDLNSKMRTFFRDKLEIEEGRTKAMLFVNCHRTPYEGEGPKPVILRFVSFEDRELVYSKSYMPVLRNEKKRILSDLPVEMKIKRSKLAKEAYKIRKGEGLKTRIIERGLSVFLEVKANKEDDWKRRSVDF